MRFCCQHNSLWIGFSIIIFVHEYNVVSNLLTYLLQSLRTIFEIRWCGVFALAPVDFNHVQKPARIVICMQTLG